MVGFALVGFVEFEPEAAVPGHSPTLQTLKREENLALGRSAVVPFTC